MTTIGVMPQIRPILDQLEGETTDQKIARLLFHQLRRYLEECEREMLDLEVKYGLTYDQFQARLERGELGDPFSSPLEQDAMRWDDLTVEKHQWLSYLKSVKSLL
jgi:hypothetical protein